MSLNFFKNVTKLLLISATTCIWSAWQAPVNLSELGQDASNPQAVVDPAGNPTVVWSRRNGVHTIIQGRSLAGATWTPVANLSQAGQGAQNPDVSVDGSGNAIAVWTRMNGFHSIVQESSSLPGGVWATPIDLSGVGQDAQNAQVAVDGSGNAVAVWSRRDGFHTIIQAATRPAGGIWSVPYNLSEPGQNASGAKVGIDASGNAVAVWVRRNGLHWITQASSLPSGGTWTTPVDLSTPGMDAQTPELAMAANGSAVAIWIRLDGANYRLQGAALNGGSWSASSDISSAGRNVNQPHLAISPTGHAVATWDSYNGMSLMLRGSSLPVGGSWTIPADISIAGYDVGDHQVAVDGSGNAVAVWQTFNGSRQVIQAATLPFGGTWSGPTVVSNPAENSTNPEVYINNAGKAISVWTTFVQTNWLIQGAMTQ